MKLFLFLNVILSTFLVLCVMCSFFRISKPVNFESTIFQNTDGD